jgi:putrescine aminotransferase
MSDAPPSLAALMPRLPVWVRAINAFGRTRVGRSLIDRQLTVESILHDAERQSGDDGLHGDVTARTALAVLLDETVTDPELTPFGRLTVRRTLLGTLGNRTRIAAEVALHPETRNVPIARPLVIAGMPRTGTTLLQRLLAEDPQFRALRCWEALSPAPSPQPDAIARDPRIARAARELRMLHRLFPAIDSLHAMSATAFEECEWLLQNALTLPGFVFESPEFPRFNAWCRTQDQQPAYDYYRLQLQILSRSFPPQRWILKGNEHLPSLSALIAVFPDAGVIQTHRDPAESLPSTLSFYLQLMGLKYAPSEARLQQAVQTMVDDYADTLDRARAVRDRADGRRFFDVPYPELVADPVGVLRRLYAHFEIEFTSDTERRLHRWLAANPQGKFGRHRYSLAQFGLSRGGVHERFANYLQGAPLTDSTPITSPERTPRSVAKLVTLEQALRADDASAFAWFAAHVNPKEARLLRLGNVHRRYVRAAGCCLYDAAGREYLDLTSGCGSLPLGHNPPEVIAAVQGAQRLPSVLLMGYPPLAGAVGKSLSALLPDGLSVVTLGSGGAEAVEIALITAALATGRDGVVAVENSYHGHTLATLALSRQGPDRFQSAAKMWDLRSVPLGDLAALEAALADRNVAAFLIEPILGEGGAVLPPVGYLRGAEALCRNYGTLLILDEIQTGFGRTGRMFALDHDGVRPDIVTVGKAFGGGVIPVSAAVTTPEIWQRAYGDGHHFQLAINTFGGNAAACAAALKTMEILVRDGLANRAATLGAHAILRLEALRQRRPIVKSIRGRGLLLGIEIDPPSNPDRHAGLIVSRMLEQHGVLTSFYERDRRILRFEPPLIITEAEIDRAVEAFDEVLGHSLGGLTLGHATTLAKRSLRLPR